MMPVYAARSGSAELVRRMEFGPYDYERKLGSETDGSDRDCVVPRGGPTTRRRVAVPSPADSFD
jgi:predicted nucleic acid-binding Zn ribbon protein